MTDKQSITDPIATAARLLREAAEELRQAHAFPGIEGWENETDAKAAYDEHMAAAQALEDWEAAAGAGGVQALSAAPAVPEPPQATSDPIQAAADAASVGHLSRLLDHQSAMLAGAMKSMRAIELAASPIDESHGDFDARIPSREWAAFVDARAALLHDFAQSPVASPTPPAEQPIGEVVVTKDEDGQIVAVTRQDDEGHILSVIATCDPAEQQAPVQVSTQWLAEMIMSDCGCSTQNQRLLDRIIERITQYESANTTPQPAPATQQAGDVVAYLDVGAGGYLDLGSELSEDALQQLPKGRHALVIAGTYGIDGYVAAPQPSPTTKPAPQQEAQEPCPTCVALARAVMLDQVSFDRKPDCYGIRQITDDESVEEWADIRTSPDVAREEANDMMATGRGEIYEVVSLWTTPQPAPAPLSDDVVKDAARYAAVRDGSIEHDDILKTVKDPGKWEQPYAVLLRGVALDSAIDAALAAQGGK